MRNKLLADAPAAEHQLELGGISTAVLQGGDGPPLVLLHGPGGSAADWMQVMPALLEAHRVVAPDLPSHSSRAGYRAYNVSRAPTPSVMASIGDLMREFGFAPIPEAELAAIAVPTRLIWGRQDLATPLAVAERISARMGWPLTVVEDCADAAHLEQPEAFLRALDVAAEVPA